MKKILKILLFTLLTTATSVTANKVKAQGVSVSLSVFQNSLTPYGRWINNGTYGQVWVNNDPGFVPYQTGGHWAYTDYGWTWVSDYDWGWAPFHYGRWDYANGTGWYWVPGYDWAPAWVAWRGGGNYYGWAPLSPGLNVSVGVSWGNQIPENRWVFAPHQYITNPNIGRYYVPRTQNVTIIKNTTIVNNVNVRNNVHYVGGPQRAEVERINHTKVQEYRVANSSRPGKTVINNNTVNVYRPVINKTTVNNNQQTTINKNSNNTIVKKNSENTTINKNNNNKTVEQNNRAQLNKTVINNNGSSKNQAIQRQQKLEKANHQNNTQQANQEVVKANENANRQEAQNQAQKIKQQQNNQVRQQQQQSQIKQQQQQAKQQQNQMRQQQVQQQRQQQNQMKQPQPPKPQNGGDKKHGDKK